MNTSDEVRIIIDESDDHESATDVVRWDSESESGSDLTKNQSNNDCDISKPKANSQTNLEEQAMRAVTLKRRELKWKLMVASQAKNKARLNEIKTELDYHRNKLLRAQELAVRLRERYLKVIRSARLSENQMKEAENQFHIHERHVADEKMELTKLALDCMNIGKSLYGENYNLPANPSSTATSKGCPATKSSVLGSNIKANGQDKEMPRVGNKQSKKSGPAVCDQSKRKILGKLSPFLRHARSQAITNSSNQVNNPTSSSSSTNVFFPPKRKHSASSSSIANSSDLTTTSLHNSLSDDLRNMITKRRKYADNPSSGRLSSIYDTKDSPLWNIVTYRLIRKFAHSDQQQRPLIDLNYTHNIYPDQYVCLPDLIGSCTDRACSYRHKSCYMKSDIDKLRELLAFRPALAFNFLLLLQLDHKRPLPESLDRLSSQQASVRYTSTECEETSAVSDTSNAFSAFQDQTIGQRGTSI